MINRQSPLGIRWVLFISLVLSVGYVASAEAGGLCLSPLLDVEAEMAKLPPEGPARYDSLIAYFQHANEGLWHHLEGINRSVHLDDKQRSLTTITAVAGLGKSFVAYNMPLGSDVNVTTIKLSKALPRLAETGKIDLVARPDLQSLDGQVVFNQLPDVVNPNALQVEDLLDVSRVDSTTKTQVVVVDDLDEVHSQTASYLVRQLKHYVDNMGETLHVIVFGRAEGFWQDDVQTDASSFVLRGPQHLTTGDLRFRCVDYGQFKYQRTLPPKDIETFMDVVASNPYLVYTLEPLAAGGAVIDLALHQVSPTEPAALRTTLFDQLLDRNHDSHGRPLANDSLYVEILEQAAIFPVCQDRIEPNTGYFEVKADDQIRVKDDQGQVRRFSLRTVLNRSGLVELDATRFPQTYYRFIPLWVQTHLIEKHNHTCHRRAALDLRDSFGAPLACQL